MYKNTFILRPFALFVLIWCSAAGATWGQALPTASTYEKHNAAIGNMNGNGRAVRIIYIVPSDQAYRKNYKDALLYAAESVRTWFLLQLNGQTFNLFRPIVEVVQSAHPANWYSTNPTGDNSVYWFWNNALGDGFSLTGGNFNDPNYRWLYYVDADPACGQVTGGTQGVALFPKNDLRGLAGEPNVPPCSTDPPDPNGVCRWVGGLGHELGHAFDLPHPEPCLRSNYSALMCLGFITYPSTYLLPQEKTWLTTSLSVKEFFLPATLPKRSKGQCGSSPSIVAIRGPNDMAGGLNVGKQALAVS